MKRSTRHWKLRWETVHARLSIPHAHRSGPARARPAPAAPIGFIIPFSEHDWYKNLIVSMQDYASRLKIGFEVIDADQNIKDEIDIRRRAIARAAADQIRPGEVILIDGGPITNYLAEALLDRRDITVITNSIAIFEILKQNANLTLILTGGRLPPQQPDAGWADRRRGLARAARR